MGDQLDELYSFSSSLYVQVYQVFILANKIIDDD